MNLKILGSSSKGNCYLLQGKRETLIIEAGIPFKDIKKGLDFDLSKVVGCLVTHEHKDHCKGVDDVLHAGIEVWATTKTHGAMRTGESRRARFLYTEGSSVRIGEFEVRPFSIQHDAVDPVGFLIHHPECGVVLFATDTYYLKYKFRGLNNIIIEANYCEDVLNEREEAGTGNQYVSDRVRRSHMSIQNCEKALLANDLSAVNNIVLIHLSDSNSDEKRFKERIEKVTGKTVHVADAGMSINFDKTPFEL